MTVREDVRAFTRFIVAIWRRAVDNVVVLEGNRYTGVIVDRRALDAVRSPATWPKRLWLGRDALIKKSNKQSTYFHTLWIPAPRPTYPQRVAAVAICLSRCRPWPAHRGRQNCSAHNRPLLNQSGHKSFPSFYRRTWIEHSRCIRQPLRAFENLAVLSRHTFRRSDISGHLWWCPHWNCNRRNAWNWTNSNFVGWAQLNFHLHPDESLVCCPTTY